MKELFVVVVEKTKRNIEVLSNLNFSNMEIADLLISIFEESGGEVK